MKPMMIFATVLLFPAVALSATWLVPGNFPTIQQAISSPLVVQGDTILVMPGTYYENIFLTKDIILKSQSGPDVTVIDGSKAGSVITIQFGIGQGSMVDGFTITNGSGTYNGYQGGTCGGGIYFQDHCFTTIVNNIITKNSANYGGGIYGVDFCMPIIRKNKITSNQVTNPSITLVGVGGGIYLRDYSDAQILDNTIMSNGGVQWASCGGICCHNASPRIEGNMIIGNGSGVNGSCGGIYCVEYSSPDIICNTIAWNTATMTGGGILCFDSTPWIASNLFYRNKATHSTTGSGGGIACSDCATQVIVTNNTFAANSAGNKGGGIFLAGSKMVITNSILWGNGAQSGKEIYVATKGPPSSDPSALIISYSDVKDGKNGIPVDSGSTLVWGPGMLTADPQFVDAAGDDYHIFYTSPCRNAGLNSPPGGLTSNDFEADPRTNYGVVDMGADEFHRHLYCKGSLTPGGTVHLRFVDTPGTTPVALFYSFGVLDPPLNSMWGLWYLQFPVFGPIMMGTIPASGVITLTVTLPSTVPGPYTIYLQAIMGASLTNLCVMEVI